MVGSTSEVVIDCDECVASSGAPFWRPVHPCRDQSLESGTSIADQPWSKRCWCLVASSMVTGAEQRAAGRLRCGRACSVRFLKMRVSHDSHSSNPSHFIHMKTASRRGVTRTGTTRWRGETSRVCCEHSAVLGVSGLGRQTERIDRVLDVAQAHITWWETTVKQQLAVLLEA